MLQKVSKRITLYEETTLRCSVSWRFCKEYSRNSYCTRSILKLSRINTTCVLCRARGSESIRHRASSAGWGIPRCRENELSASSRTTMHLFSNFLLFRIATWPRECFDLRQVFRSMEAKNIHKSGIRALFTQTITLSIIFPLIFCLRQNCYVIAREIGQKDIRSAATSTYALSTGQPILNVYVVV